MVLNNIEVANRVCDYFEVAPPKFHVNDMNILTADLKGTKAEGLNCIVRNLVKCSKRSEMLGENPTMKALVYQWLEYSVLYINHIDTPANARRIFIELNESLKDTTYITGVNKTAADVVLFYSLYHLIAGWSYPDKAEYVNLSRWFDNMQQDNKIVKSTKPVPFDLLHLYL